MPRLFQPGISGNPGGRPKGERALLRRMYGQEGKKIYARIEAMRLDPQTPRKLKTEIDLWLAERLHGRAQQHVDVTGTAMDALATAIATDKATHGAK